MGEFEGGVNLILRLLPLILLQFLILKLIRFLKKSWWAPIKITKFMESQGIRGPPYRFFHGSTAEAKKMMENAIVNSMELSHNIFPKVQPHFHSWIKLYGRNVLTWQGATPRLVVGEPEMAKEILGDRDERFTKYEPPEFMKKLLGDGLATTKGPKWVRQRKLAVHAFHSENLKGMIPAITASVEIMLQNWIKFEGKEVDFFKEFCILTSEIISRTAFGSSYIEGKTIFTKIDELTAIVARNFHTLRLPFLRSKDEIDSDLLEKDIRASILKLIQRREQRKKNGEEDDGFGDDLLGLLMKAKHENGEVTLEDIVDECKTFYFAGQETTSIMLSWTCLLLAINTEWQDRVRVEVHQIFGDRRPSSEDFAAFSRLKTMTMVINESLRLYPPVLNILRIVTTECKVGDLLLPQGMQIQISPLILHHDATTWGENAQHFMPEKFAGGVAGATAGGSAAAFVPFGFGPRFCVGQGLAMLEAKVALAMVLQRYSFSLSPAYAHSPVSRLTCRPLHGIQAMLERL